MNYKSLKVWELADKFAFEVYSITRLFPKHEIFGITSQLRRAALSVPLNIVEGYSRKGDKELARFVNIAIGSLAEAEYLIDFSLRLGYIKNSDFEKLEFLKNELSKKLWSFYKRVKEAG